MGEVQQSRCLSEYLPHISAATVPEPSPGTQAVAAKEFQGSDVPLQFTEDKVTTALKCFAG